MENASKALIIAGAILISILIVGLGVIIYNNVADVAKTGTLDSTQINSHNSPFEGYFGDYVSGSNVKALFTQVQANNNAAAANDEKIGNFIYMKKGTGGSATTDITASAIKTGKTYKVYVANENLADGEDDGKGYWKNGYLKTIVIEENT